MVGVAVLSNLFPENLLVPAWNHKFKNSRLACNSIIYSILLYDFFFQDPMSDIDRALAINIVNYSLCNCNTKLLIILVQSCTTKNQIFYFGRICANSHVDYLSCDTVSQRYPIIPLLSVPLCYHSSYVIQCPIREPNSR